MDPLEVGELLSGLAEYDFQLWIFPTDIPSSWTGIDTMLESLNNSSMAMLEDVRFLIYFAGANFTVASNVMVNINITSSRLLLMYSP